MAKHEENVRLMSISKLVHEASIGVRTNARTSFQSSEPRPVSNLWWIRKRRLRYLV